MKKILLGRSGLHVTPICMGAGPIGGWTDNYGYPVDEARARETLRALFESPLNCLDTSRNYAEGDSEARIGVAIRERGGLPEGFVLSTKVDREDATGRFDAARVRQSFEKSLEALALDRVQILHLHDPEYCRDLHEVTGTGGALDELFKIKEEGLADAIGLAMGRIEMMFPMVRNWPFDVILNHSRLNLVNRSAGELFDYANEHNIGIMNASVYASGILAKGSSSGSFMTYREADAEGLLHVRRLEELCEAYGVPLGAAALQLSLRDHRIGTTVVGVSRAERIEQTLGWASIAIPDTFWEALEEINYSMDDPQEWSD